MKFDQHQAATARWMGYNSAEEMNAEHDELHRIVCSTFGLHSLALSKAAGAVLTPAQEFLASLEEDAILHLQRFLAHSLRGVPEHKQ